VDTPEKFSRYCGYVIGTDCDKLERDAAFKLRKLRGDKTCGITVPLDVIGRLLKNEGQMPLTPVSQRGLEKVIKCDFIGNSRVCEAVRTADGRKQVMQILKKLAEMKQFGMLRKSLVCCGENDPPAGYTLYRSEQKNDIMALIDGLPKEVKGELLNSVWTYDCNGGFKVTGEELFGDGRLMPL
jgi:hypothetical protein